MKVKMAARKTRRAMRSRTSIPVPVPAFNIVVSRVIVEVTCDS
jgi:hypothetical protein